ncbi:MAG TPA: ISL3 family transposase [Candidatus Micrarchaeaceae archaeon]|nr:ISL3 family transposase [Candidatus Micrarchaeaceae archaeon]
MRQARVWARLLGIAGAIVERVELEGDDLVVRVRLRRRQRRRCGKCGKRGPLYDPGGGARRWRALDLGSTRCYLEAAAPRVSCPQHGPTVVQVPWADHDTRSTRSFDDQVAWLAVHSDASAVSELMRISWRTVGWIVARVTGRLRKGTDSLAGLRRIGIDEISFRRGHRYLIVVLDHDTNRLVWAAEGRDEKTLDRFFFELGEERRQLITHVSADAGNWIAPLVALRCPNAVRCMDNFHVIQWATEALDQVRREVWNAARRGGHKQLATDLKKARWALWKGAENLTDKQRGRLGWIEKTNLPLYQAYLMKEQLVRHEAHVDRVNWNVHHRPVAAGRRSWGQSEPGDAGEGRSSPDNDGTDRHCQTVRVRQARRIGVRTEKPAVKPPKALNQLQPGGYGLGSGARLTESSGRRLLVRSKLDRPGGHEESLRRTRGEAAGEKLGSHPANRSRDERGNLRGAALPPTRQVGEGQDRRRPMAPRRGGVPVVVRGRESRPHGKGGQQVRSEVAGMPGGPW